MAEREADRAHPDRLRQQAVSALVSDAGREISPEFRRRLKKLGAAPGLFAANDLVASAHTRLEAEIAQSMNMGHAIGATDAVREALRRRGEGYTREQKCQLVADRHPNASIASESVKKAFDDSASVAAALILEGRPVAHNNNRVRASENLLVRRSGGPGL